MNIFENIYFKEDSEYGFTRFITGALRNGGLYFNPNQAAKYLTILLAFVLVLAFKNRDKVIVSSFILTSIFLTGSRTGLIVSMLILLGYFIFIHKSKIASYFLIVFGAISVFIIGEGTRSLNFEQTGSASYKYEAFLDYFNIISLNQNFGKFIFGNFTTYYPYLQNKFNLNSKFEFGFDSDIGILLSAYGFFFLIIYIIFYYKIFQFLNRTNFIIIIPFIVWPLTSTVIFSIKTSIVYFSVLSLVLSNKIKLERIDNTSSLK